MRFDLQAGTTINRATHGLYRAADRGLVDRLLRRPGKLVPVELPYTARRGGEVLWLGISLTPDLVRLTPARPQR